MNNAWAVLAGTLLSTSWLVPTAIAQPACVTQNFVVPSAANSSDKAAPFFIDTTASISGPSRRPATPRARIM